MSLTNSNSNLNTNIFYWRHATIAEGVKYSYDEQCPYEIYNGLISLWEDKTKGMYPTSFPKQASACFKSNSINPLISKKYFDVNQKDQYGFYWLMSEEEAHNFLMNKYPKIYAQYVTIV
jgi:hypothetical protein